MSSGIKVAQKVRVGVENQNGQILQFFCYIKQILQDRLVLVFSESNAVFSTSLVEGSSIRLSIYTPIGILLMDSIVITEPQNCEFEVEFEKARKRIQRRRYVRSEANYRMIIEQNGETYTALSKDIGGGGIRFVCDANLQVNQLLRCKLFFPGCEEGVFVIGRAEKKQRFRENEYLIEFLQIEEVDRNKIIKKCLELEAKRIREV